MDIDDAFLLRFVNAYRSSRNALLAMRIAGYDGTDDDARLEAQKLLDRPVVQQLISGPPHFPYEIHDVLNELAGIAFAPWRDFVKVQMNKDGEIVNAILDPTVKYRSLVTLGEYFGAWGARKGKRPANARELAKRVAEEMARVQGRPAPPPGAPQSTIAGKLPS